jgi:hypothetical protein
MKYDLPIVLDGEHTTLQAERSLYRDKKLWSVELNDKNYILWKINDQWVQNDHELTPAQVQQIGQLLEKIDAEY